MPGIGVSGFSIGEPVVYADTAGVSHNGTCTRVYPGDFNATSPNIDLTWVDSSQVTHSQTNVIRDEANYTTHNRYHVLNAG